MFLLSSSLNKSVSKHEAIENIEYSNEALERGIDALIFYSLGDLNDGLEYAEDEPELAIDALLYNPLEDSNAKTDIGLKSANGSKDRLSTSCRTDASFVTIDLNDVETDDGESLDENISYLQTVVNQLQTFFNC